MSPDLHGRVAIVTGGADGIGRATALLLAEHGARVVVGDLHPRPDNDAVFAARGIAQVGCDVRKESEVRLLVQRALSMGERLHVVVNNAGIGLVKPITQVSEEEWDACLDTNLKGAFLLAKHAMGPLREAGGGCIVNISSNAGLLPRAHDPVYSISKAALIALTKSLALCHAADRIRVNAICPGPVGNTGMMNADLAQARDPEALAKAMIDASPLARALGRMIEPEEVAQAVLYLVSDHAWLVTGTCIAIDGGKSLGVPART